MIICYVSSVGNDIIKRYNGTTGAYIDDFVSAGSGGINEPRNIMFSADGTLYVSATSAAEEVYRYNGTTGAFIDVFTSGLSTPAGALIAPVPGCVEICDNSIDDDGDGLTDCNDPDCDLITLSNVVVSACVDQPLRDVATVDVDVSWVNAPANDTIEVSVGDKTEYIFVAAGATSPQTIQFITSADGSVNNGIIAGWRNNTTLCQDTITFNAPAACSNDTIACNILYVCGETKPGDGDAWDHGLMNYLDAMNGAKSVTGVLAKPDASGMGTYDPNSPSTPLAVNLLNYDLIFVSSTTENQLASDLIDSLKGYPGGILNNNYLIINALGMSASAGGFTFQTNAYTSDVAQTEIYNYDNISPVYNYVLTRGDYLANADSYLWMFAGNQSGGINGILFHNEVTDVLSGISGTHGTRTYLGFHMNGLYENAANGGALPAPASSYFSPEKHLTLDGKNYLDQAILLAAISCADEICNNSIDDDGDGDIDIADSDCACSATAQNPIWLVDEQIDPGNLSLWSFIDYSDPNTGTNYGRLQYFDPTTSTIRDAGDASDMEALGVNPYTGIGYFLSSSKTNNGPSGAQALFQYDLNEASNNIGNIVLTLIGHIDKPNGRGMEALAFNPTTNRFYTADPVDSDGGASTSIDTLYSIDLSALNADPMIVTIPTKIGPVEGMGETNTYVDGLEFDDNGNLYAVDGADESLQQLDPATGAIIAIIDTFIGGGTGHSSVDIETICWDAGNQQMLALDNDGSHQEIILIDMTQNGNNSVLMSYVDAPGMPSNADFEGSAMLNPCVPKVAIGNLVFKDNDSNNVFTSGEGLDGVIVHLYQSGVSPSTAVPLAIDTTSGGGFYLFENLIEGDYFLHIPASEFGSGEPLENQVSISSSGGDNSVDNDDNGVDAANPDVTGISSDVITLSDNGEAVNASTETGTGNTADDGDDNNGDLTVDFGFRPDSEICNNGIDDDGDGDIDCADADCSAAVVTGANSPICAGQDLNLTESGGDAVSWNWSGPNSFTSSLQNPTISAATTAASGTYSVTVTNANGCTATSSGAVTVNANPTATAGSNSPLCEGADLNLTESGGDAVSWNWSGPNSFTSSLQNPTISSATTAATGTYNVTVTDGNGCTSTGSVAVTINANPITTVGSNSPLCEGSDLNLTESGGDAASWSWSGPNSFTSSLQNPTISSATTAATGTYNVTITDGNGCTSTGSVAVTINTSPTATVGSNSPLCEGSDLNLTESGGDAVSWSWSGPNSFTSSLQNPTISGASTAAAGTYNITITDSGGCTSTGSVAVTINASPTITAGSNSPLCAGSDLNLTESGSDAVSWNWSGPNSFTSSLQNPTINSATTVATGTYNVTITDGSGCTSTGSVAVTINTSPTITTGSNSPLCVGEDLNLTESGGDAVSWSWSGPNSFTSSLQNPTISGATTAAAGTYNVTITASGGCTSTTSVVVTVNSGSTATAGSNSPLCEGTDLNLTESGGDAVSWFWTGPNSFTSNLQNPTISTATNTAAGTYFVTITDGNGCTATNNVIVTFHTSPTVSVGSNSPLCEGQNLNLTESGGDAVSWNWTGPNSFTSSLQNPTISSATIAATGTYNVTITDGNGCTNSASIAVSVVSSITATPSSNSPLCEGADLNLTESGGDAVSWSWSGPNGFTSTAQNPSITNTTLAAAGTYDVTITGSSGCTAIASTTVTINALPSVTLSLSDTDECVSSSNLALDGGSPVGGTFSGPGVSGTNFDASVAGVGAHTITYTYIDGNGCTNSATDIITVVADPVVSLSLSDTEECVNSTSLTLSDGSPAGGTYSGPGVSGTNFDASAAGVGTHTITYSYVDGNGCTGSATDDITVFALPVVSLTLATTESCEDNTSINLSGGSPAGGSYSGSGVSGTNF